MKAIPFPSIATLDRPAHLRLLSGEQFLTVFHTLQIWRGLLNNPNSEMRVRIDRNPEQPEHLPSWGEWSGATWVSIQACQYRAEVFARPRQLHITLLMHLALPPTWHKDPLSEREKETMRRYGYWRTVSDWVPPEITGSRSVWVDRP